MSADAEPKELNMRVLRPVFRYVRKQHGRDVLEKLIEAAGLPTEYLHRSSPWISVRAFEHILSSVRKLTRSDREFVRACAYDLKRVYGPMLLVVRCITPLMAYRSLARTAHMVSRVSGYEVVSGTRTSIRLRYTSKYKESRLMCLSRQAQLRAGACLWWGIPPAKVRVHKSLANGDDCCDYAIRWQEPLRLHRSIGGGLLGALFAYLLPASIVPTTEGFLAFVAVGLCIGLISEYRRMLADYRGFANDTSREVETVVQDHGRAIDEILALHQREQRWSRHLEHRAAKRSAMLEQVFDKLQTPPMTELIATDRLRTLSHDINNPLTVLSATVGYLKRNKSLPPEETHESIQAIDGAVTKLTRLMSDLSDVVHEGAHTRLELEPIDIDLLANRVRRQLRATVVSRDIRVTVFQTREAPREVRAITILLERVLDNLLTNACKYTDRGSIIVEVGGTPGFLLLKISDSGRGIGPERLEQVFLSGAPDPNPAVGDSHGHGLAIVVGLLDQLDGRLEIMSQPGEGTTLWVYIPVSPAQELAANQADADNSAHGRLARFRRVVKIRSRI